MFPESVTKGPVGFPYLLFRAVHVWAFVMVDNSIFLAHVIFVLGGSEKSPYCIVPLKVNLYAYLVASVPPMYGTVMYMFLLLESMLLVVLGGPLVAVSGSLMLCLWLNFNWRMLSDQGWNFILIMLSWCDIFLDVDFSYCWLNLIEAWYSLEQYIGLKEDKLSSTTVNFIRSEGNLETKHLYWFRKPKMC